MRIDARGLQRLRLVLWVVLAAVSLVFAAASLLSAANFSDIAYAKLAVETNANIEMSASGLGPSGGILNGTVFTLNVNVSVKNPSSRQLDLQMLLYQCQVRDYPYEDQSGAGANLAYYFPVIVENQTYEKDLGIVNPGQNRTFRAPQSGAPWTISLNSNPATFMGLKNILNYALAHKGYQWNQSEWDHTFVFTIIVTGVPTTYYGANSGYLIELPVVKKTQLIVQGGG